MDTTAHDLRLLSIWYLIQGGIVITYALLALCYLGLMGAILWSEHHSVGSIKRASARQDALRVVAVRLDHLAIGNRAGRSHWAGWLSPLHH
jgi:hypothetical protein